MLFLIIFLGLLFIGTGFILTEKNAPTLLSGYNTLSKEEQAKFDLKSYLPAFRKFHLFLGLSVLVLGLILHFLVSKNAGLMFVTIYPILAYIFFIFWTKKYEPERRKGRTNLGIVVLLLTGVLVVSLLFKSFQETKIEIHDTAVAFVGMYGETVDFQDISELELLEKLPKISLKLNGTAVDGIYKGKFKTANEGIVKLLINNAENKPYIKINRKDDKAIFFASKNDDNQRIFEELNNRIK